jgi:uncharacterized membrane protein YfcA
MFTIPIVAAGSVACERRAVPDTLTVLLLVVAAFGAGTVDAIAGGGGLITVPALLATGMPIHTALGTTTG